jgi:Ser/Thr protein kinase RdoA (MazF antagonist)
MPTLSPVPPPVDRQTLIDFVRSEFLPHVEGILGRSVVLRNSPTQGNLNFSFHVATDADALPQWILRAKDGSELEHTFMGPMACTYAKERTLQSLLAGQGIRSALPVGQILLSDQRLGRHGPFAASIQTFLAGEDGSRLAAHGTPGEIPIIKELGRLARGLSSISFGKFGDIIERDGGTFQLEWSQYVEKLSSYSLQPESLAVLPDQLRSAFTARVERLKQARERPMLVHADLRASNALFDDTRAAIALIDWERACASIVEEEFGRILNENFVDGQRVKDLSAIRQILSGSGITPQFAAFLDGYGVSCEEYQHRYRQRSEDFLSILCVDFSAHFVRERYRTHPAWEVPAAYARQAAEAVLARVP